MLISIRVHIHISGFIAFLVLVHAIIFVLSFVPFLISVLFYFRPLPSFKNTHQKTKYSFSPHKVLPQLCLRLSHTGRLNIYDIITSRCHHLKISKFLLTFVRCDCILNVLPQFCIPHVDQSWISPTVLYIQGTSVSSQDNSVLFYPLPLSTPLHFAFLCDHLLQAGDAGTAEDGWRLMNIMRNM
jgi:hypothetical protein